MYSITTGVCLKEPSRDFLSLPSGTGKKVLHVRSVLMLYINKVYMMTRSSDSGTAPCSFVFCRGPNFQGCNSKTLWSDHFYMLT